MSGVDYAALASGKWYEELIPGTVFKHSITRTVTETDNLLFCALTHNSAWLHLDEEYCKTQMFGRRIVNSMFTLSLICGIQVADVTAIMRRSPLASLAVAAAIGFLVGLSLWARDE